MRNKQLVIGMRSEEIIAQVWSTYVSIRTCEWLFDQQMNGVSMCRLIKTKAATPSRRKNGSWMLVEFKRVYRCAVIYESNDNWVSTRDACKMKISAEMPMSSDRAVFYSPVTFREIRIYRILLTSYGGTWRKPMNRLLQMETWYCSIKWSAVFAAWGSVVSNKLYQARENWTCHIDLSEMKHESYLV